MSNTTVSRPAKPFQAYPLQQLAKYQAWVILALLVVGGLVDMVLGHNGLARLIVTKNLLAGSVLTWVGQMVFAKISLGLSGYHQRRQIVHRFYLAHMTKWAITLIGFAIIFKFLRPLSAMWVLVGFMVLQISYVILMYRQKN